MSETRETNDATAGGPPAEPVGVSLDKPARAGEPSAVPAVPGPVGPAAPPGSGGDASFDYAGFDDFGDLADPLTDALPAEHRRPTGPAYAPVRRPDAPSGPQPGVDPAQEPTPGPAPPDEDDDETILIDGRAIGGRTPFPPLNPPRPARAVGAVPAATAEAPPEPEPEPGADAAGDAAGDGGLPPGGQHGLGKLVAALRTRRALGTQLVIGLLCGLLGFGAVVQVRLRNEDTTFQTARQTDLIRILDDLNDRSERLTSEIRDLNARREELQFGTDRSQAALQEAEQRRATLGILAGTVPARGPGITLTIPDPQRKVDAAVLLDTLQELRDAGAEAVQINDVRVVASTDFLDAEGGRVRVDGRLISAPYVFKVIGDPDTLDPALRIPGGVFSVLDERGSAPTVDTRRTILVDAVRPAQAPEYARPAQQPPESSRTQDRATQGRRSQGSSGR